MTAAEHPADTHDLIRVQGARENNLKDVSVDIPKRRLTVFTGVSGSGKSSLVFDTIAAESRRMIDETYSAFVQGFMPSVPRPDVDVLEGLTTAIIVDQERLGANPRSTVGTVTDANAMLRILFSKLGQPYIGGPTAFSFNIPTQKASGVMTEISGINMTYEGLIPKITKSMLSKDLDALQPHIRAFVERVATFAVCPECDGTRLTEGARSSKIDGVSIADACRMQVTDLAAWVRGLDLPGAGPLLQALSANLDAFVTLGLGYLSLDRPSGTLSGGEAQRIKMLRHLGSSLTDVTYVFDEPTIGLHPHDIQRMNGLLLRLRDKGNTVLVVEHKPETIAIGDHVVDLGPGAGSAGGEICYQGSVEGLTASGTLTGQHLDDRAQLKGAVRDRTGAIEVRGASTNNLQNVDVDIPTGVLTVVTGVAGSGKSSLIHGSVTGREGVVAIDQSAIKGSRRSNPATYTGLLEPIRKAFAKANGVKPALFSANSEGACPTCKGAGVIITELGFMDTIETPCEDCGGKRFQAAVLEYKLGGKDITEVLDLPVSEARVFFSEGETKLPAAAAILGRLEDVGLGYLSLGQPLSTLSGGERQRIKLAIQMGEKGDVYVLDEPTTGLHLADVDTILGLLDRLVDAGKTVVVIEHHQAVMAHADWIIDVGPGAGHDGGRIVFEGTPTELVADGSTLTGEHLAAYVNA
ncbi:MULTISPECIES: excinuclease ABC subunit UvrA [unclassified Microbacterium]|uniref:excinuclease ABC subunit UvrA n=1 Tax=unclassified Microbacterium TaxID=2609290 RepID=UPI002468ABD8|nr:MULTISPECIES: excinuclease ABC subunit UvrA [unclassified Microbacterium]MDH5132794.1 excinuclease ABC subunit UvrA [Microbacterium sp. RD10]MDH5136489.1 excinuclease ABC subunit UvrA [Microbacterium sp. RD11]MDH5144366.1 excinuclease ABC subunit UvrA [Microbacterium sp. RD12]MDH5154878.1 excinuclease ABC subunit UvrA [Microbacterium sp. RD06]MDH5164860.1 excinuclease ABC subunit UvrA [Microbacterium sp. RD02]